ncbi:unnamed protein product [Clonostachys rosea]|uniref:Zn(2)-C6 fungal-type domain-containing protein n=1 Tax=Bionectria ochroleuca TaxID=29856 RepID=A0ABY6TVV7_BIOOC|nr:unnamed protein product [Clonostachys rosea]
MAERDSGGGTPEGGGDKSTPKSGGSSTTKQRRSHRKSRNGCAECKRRHMRCDEARPACRNCSMAERACSYPAPARSGPSPVPAPEKRPQPPLPPQQMRPPAQWPPQSLPSFNESFANTPTSPSIPVSAFTPQHLMLLHHVETAMENEVLGDGQTTRVVDISIRHTVECPYLIDQLLAFAAIHKAHQQPESAAKYRHQATELQTRALAYFTKDTESRSSDDMLYAAPRFLFAALLGLHVLAETLAYNRSDFQEFIDRFIDCIHLHKGIRTVILPTWEMLLQSELLPILSLTTLQYPQEPCHGKECEPLRALLDASDLDSQSIDACQRAVQTLQWAFDLSGRLPRPDLPHAVTGFSVVVSVEFGDVLRRHRAEALIILAYYGVLVHRARKYWMFGDTGVFLIRDINKRLGSYWQEPMKWPLQVLEEEHD